MVTKKVYPVRDSDGARKSKRKSPPDRRAGPPANARHKQAGRIPGVDAGDVVDTSVREKKKVCFNIGGKWFFRMVDPDWRAPGRPPKRKGNRDAGGKGGSGQG
ncbi:MAG: hypothetical protein JRI81_14720 [Deltaproteobacteria bacterium]|nr:hypothetical protein [Deltaproteobacteria bacterium]